MTKIIGLTGGIGSGKTTVLNMFVELGAVSYVADVEAKRLMNEHEPLKQEISSLLGDKAYQDGKLSRGWVAQQVFTNAKKLAKLNALVHPRVREDFLNFVKKTKGALIIYEAAILFESGSDVLCDAVITVVTDKDKRIQRVMDRDNVTSEAVVERMKHQLSDEERIKKSDFVIYNDDLKYTRKQVQNIYKLLLE